MDPYAPCPCGSGKKVKFCCQAILPDMEKIRRLQENHQPRMALQLIDKLLKSNPDNAWLSTQRALALFNEQKMEEARDTLVAVLRKQPDLPLANGLLALAMTELEPIPKCMKVIHRAFLKAMGAEPQLCSVLAEILAEHFSEAGQDMAARQHLALALRHSPDEMRQQIIEALLTLDSDQDIPYPFRGGHVLPKFQSPDDLSPEGKKALRLFQMGCFSEAADLLTQLSQQGNASPELWHGVGLLRAWSGEDGVASAAFHKSAQMDADESRATDVETLAQLFDRREKENLIAARMRSYKVDGLSRLLSRLDNVDRLCRIPDLGNEPEQLAASYEILDRPLPTEEELSQLTLESVPRTIGRLALFDNQVEQNGPLAVITALEGHNFSEAVRHFEAAAGELASRLSPEQSSDNESSSSEDPVVSWYSKDELTLSDAIFIPPGFSGKASRELRKQSVAKCLDQTWLNTPQPCLKGKTPLEASEDESLRIPLRAAIRVFDAYLDRRGVILDKQQLESRLGLAPLPPVVITQDQDIHQMSVSDMDRIPLDSLSDETFYRLLQRAMAVRHSGMNRRLLVEFLTNRPNLIAQHVDEAEQLHSSLVDLCHRSLLDEEAYDWLRRGFEFSKAHGNRFDHLVLWKMRELLMRVQDPEAPETRALLIELWNFYGAKLPAIRARLSAFVEQSGIAPPWESAIVTPQSSGEGQLVWAAEGAEASSSVNKLWLPD